MKTIRTVQVPDRVLAWQNGIGKNSPKEMAQMYAKDAVLVPTFDKILKGRKMIQSYFKDFLNKQNMKCRITDAQTIQMSAGYNVTNGYYIFSFDDADEPGEKEFVFARFTYVLNPQGEIITHHSSEEPEDVD